MSVYDFCDDCGQGVEADWWLVPTGKIDPDLKVPVVKMVCDSCHRRQP